MSDLGQSVGLELLSVGRCTGPTGVLAPECLVDVRGGARLSAWWRPLVCPALVGLVRHPVHGVVLVDTGYAPRFFDATASWPERVYCLATPVTLDAHEVLGAQLAARGIALDEVAHVVVTHWHADHVGALRDLPSATIHTRRDAIEPLAKLARGALGRARATRAAFLPSLVPDDLDTRARWLEPIAELLPAALGALASDDPANPVAAYDVFGDGTLVAVDLPGHAPGMVGVYVRSTRGPVLLAADACWRSADLRGPRPVHRLARGILWDARASEATLRRLAVVARSTTVIPSHCAEAIDAWRAGEGATA